MHTRTRYVQTWIFGLSLFLLTLGACVLDDKDRLQTEAADQPILLNSDGIVAAQCEGFTSGGGQKVRGHIDVEVLDIVSSTWRATMAAENWKKNIGWNKKRTAELRIVGSIATIFGGTRTNQCEIDYDSGGELKNEIGFMCDFQAPSSVTIDARLTFFGRDGTVCSL